MLSYSYGFSGAEPSEASGRITAAPGRFFPISDTDTILGKGSLQVDECSFSMEFFVHGTSYREQCAIVVVALLHNFNLYKVEL